MHKEVAYKLSSNYVLAYTLTLSNFVKHVRLIK